MSGQKIVLEPFALFSLFYTNTGTDIAGDYRYVYIIKEYSVNTIYLVTASRFCLSCWEEKLLWTLQFSTQIWALSVV